MSEIQLMTVVLSIVLSSAVAFSAMMISNGRISDAVSTVNNRMNDFKESLQSEIKASAAELRSEIKDVRMDIERLRMSIERMDDNIARLLADHDRRITKLETRTS